MMTEIIWKALMTVRTIQKGDYDHSLTFYKFLVILKDDNKIFLKKLDDSQNHSISFINVENNQLHQNNYKKLQLRYIH